MGRKFNSEYKDLRVIFESESTRSLDLQTIESRFLHGTYGDSHKRGPVLTYCFDYDNIINLPGISSQNMYISKYKLDEEPC